MPPGVLNKDVIRGECVPLWMLELISIPISNNAMINCFPERRPLNFNCELNKA